MPKTESGLESVALPLGVLILDDSEESKEAERLVSEAQASVLILREGVDRVNGENCAPILFRTDRTAPWGIAGVWDFIASPPVLREGTRIKASWKRHVAWYKTFSAS